MSPSDATNRNTRREWRELGFYYEHQNRQWRLVGSKAGLSSFSRLLREYVNDPRNRVLGEHEHYGPYLYLKVVTAAEPRMIEDGIYGPLEDLARLADLFDARLEQVAPGESFEVEKEYAPENEYPLRVEVEEEGYDPAGADPLLPSEQRQRGSLAPRSRIHHS